LLLLACSPVAANANSAPSKILCRPELADARRQELAARLREITGWRKLHFDGSGALNFGAVRTAGGSQTARELLEKAGGGNNLLIIEDASDRAEVVFSRVIEGRWTRDAEAKPRVLIVQVDFADFSRVMGDRAALAAFNVGWALLHEISHAVNDSTDTERAGETGECEALVNQMRRECGLAERAEYHYHFMPGVERNEFKTRYVRLAFEQQQPSTKRKRRLWIMWDADAVGGLARQKN
ncbi:MAG: hypothetical protein H7Z38_16145, partial [Rubrivivax sp.]|nr:hypothetical protein [Pyrinomonadaceae bacterium]